MRPGGIVPSESGSVLGAVESVIDALRDGNPWIRHAAARALFYLRDLRAVGPLIGALADESEQVRYWAAVALELYEKLPDNVAKLPKANLTVPANLHTMQIHDQLNGLLSEISGITLKDLRQLREYYREHPLSIAIVADPTMVPMYFYYNPDGRPDTHNGGVMGYSVPSDFIYADVDVDYVNPENDTYSAWPFMENTVGRVTGWDAQDCSALIDRTIFYNTIINRLGDWKNNALVQTGCGLEFQNLPIITRLGQLLYSGRGEPTKFPTGESTFMNLRLTNDMKTGGFNAQHTFFLKSQRVGFTKEGLDKIRKAGLLNRLIFPGPEALIHFISSQKKVTGGQLQLNSSFIFGFAHGFYNLFEFGDILIDSRGFPGVTTLARLNPMLRSDLSGLGSYEVRTVQNMDYGPSVVFIESCITARTDGIDAENVLSQAFLHAGVNAYIGATRVTADPGYLEPRPLPKGCGIGILGRMKAILNTGRTIPQERAFKRALASLDAE
jgi:hypothetical protein